MKKSNKNYVGHIKKIFPTFLFLLLFVYNTEAAENYKIPDFAFPKDVEADCSKQLELALENKDNIMALRYCLNLAVARNLLTDSEGVAPNISLFDSITPKLQPEYRRIAYLLQAEILFQDYSHNRNKYDSRNLPLEDDFPKDPQEWSGLMFKHKIYNLINQGCQDIEKFPKTNIKEISILLSNPETASRYGLTVNEFIAFKGASILQNLSNGVSSYIIPFYAHTDNPSLEELCQEKAQWLLTSIITNMAEDNSVIKAIAMLKKQAFLPDSDQESYLQKSAEELRGTEGESLLLYALWQRYGNNTRKFYHDINRCLSMYPDGYGAGQLEYALSEITKEKIQVELPRISLSNTSIEGKASVSNLTEGYLLVYRLSPDEYDIYDRLVLKKFKSSKKPVHILHLKEDGVIPFTNEISFQIPGLSPGVYVMIPSKSKTLTGDFSKSYSNVDLTTIRVSDIAIITSYNSNEKESGRAFVVKGTNQEPIEGASVSYFSDNIKTPKGRLITNKEGWVKIPANGYFRLEASYKGNTATTDAGFGYYPQNENNQSHISILTDLEVYRPGDTLRYAIIGWKQEKTINSLVKDAKVSISLRDVNYRQIDCDILVLNEEGRTSGEFVIPSGRLLGRYQIQANFLDKSMQGGGSTAFYVEEYKLPSFIVSLQQEDTELQDSIMFQGNAQTFTSLPITDAPVVVNIEYQPWRWWSYGRNASYSFQTFTDASGNFRFSLPLENLKGTVFEKGRYNVSAQVTSANGDTQISSPLSFYLGKAYEIRPAIPDKIKVTGDSIVINVPVFDIVGLPEKTQLEYLITNLNERSDTIKGKFISPCLTLPSVSIPSGKYKVEFKAQDSEDWITTETIIWRSDDKIAPYATPLWIPQNEYSYRESQNSIDIRFGSFWTDWLLCVISDGEKILKSEWLAPQDSLWTLPIDIPENSPTLFVTLSGMHNLQAETGQIKIVPKKSLEKMDIETISFRDKISAGDKEKWTFRFKVGENYAPYVNAFAVMSDKALNSIYDFKWRFNIFGPSVYNKVHLSSPRKGFASIYKTFTNFKVKAISNGGNLLPTWETYGYPLVSFGNRFDGAVLYRSMATKNAMADMAETTGVTVAQATESAMDDAQETGEGGTNKESDELRPVEMPLAFFMPKLKADENGELCLNFTVPNFNTTWQLQVAGYNESLLNSTIVLNAVASKPVIVKTNLPQFLRTSDKAEISATIFNNSEEGIPIKGRLEIINAATQQIIASTESPEENMSPSGNKTFSIKFEVPDDEAAIIVRAYALSETHSDGEQGLIPILPSNTPVTEATTFYAGSDQESVIVSIPKIKKGANVTLKYCDNPLWEALLSLPGLTEACNASAISVSRWLYATLLASDIINSNPEISRVLKGILESKDPSLSESNLEKDAQLKITALEATPWLNNAAGETARIRSLQKYFDTSDLLSQIDFKIKSLQNLQKPDGGWSWFEGMKSSSYITAEVLNILGYLKSKNLLTFELEQMAKKGVRYYDSTITNLYEKNKKLNVYASINYFYTRDKLELPMSGKLKSIKKETFDSIVSQWKHWDIVNKTKGALILLSDESYKEKAYEIAASLKQVIHKRIPVDQEALLLELFEKTPGNSEAIEKVMQSILLQKETTDWSSDYNNIAAVYSLVSLTPPTELTRNNPQIFVGKERLDLPEGQTLTGNFTLNLDAKAISGKTIRIQREAGVPAWGGVIAQYISPIKEVKRAAVDNLSVEKRIFKENADGEIKEVSSFRKGDKVTVVLNLNVGKDMDFITIADSRSACLQPDDNNSGYTYKDNLWFYREIQATKTSFFIENLPAGKYVISYDCHIDRDGEYSLGIAEVQCLYSPSQVAHSAGSILKAE